MNERTPPPAVLGRRVTQGEFAPGEFAYSVVEIAPDTPWAGGERRGSSRLRTRLRDGLIGKTKHRLIVQCAIKDRSRTGARLQLDAAQVLPREFVLTDGAARTLFRATLIWQDGREAGVELVEVE